MNKRRLLAIAVAVCLIAILACGSLAYFVADASVKNEFYVASYDPNDPNPPTAEELFSIAIYETDAQGEKDYDGLTYTGVLPGAELDKDPTVVNTGEYSAYVRLKVTFDQTDKWAAAGVTDLTTLLTGLNTTEWTQEADETVTDDTAKTVTYVFYREDALAKDDESTLFEGVKVPDSLTVEQMVALANFNITVAGDAIQSDNVGADIYEAFVKFEAQVNP